MIECLLTKILVLSVLMASYSLGAAGDYAIAKPGCRDKCGGVKIPFPFGIGDGCYYANVESYAPKYMYRIDCYEDDNNSSNKNNSTAVMPIFGDTEVLSISLEDHSLRVSSGVAYNCSTPSSNPIHAYGTLDTTLLAPLILSSARNKFVSIGCGTTSLLQGLMSDVTTGNTASTCTAFCYDSMRNGTCNPYRGCCETSILRNFSNPSIFVDGSCDMPSHNCICSYAFVGEVGSYNFLATNLTATETDCYSFRVPVVYDWFMRPEGYDNCSEAKEKSGHDRLKMMCSSNSIFECADINIDAGVQGFLTCQCSEGYNGNPYLPNGCQDINECAEERLNECERPEYCVNTKGGYHCRCTDGLLGNATRAIPCIPAPVAHGSGKLTLGVSIGMGSMTGFILLIYGLYKIIKRKKEINERERNFKKNGGLLLQQEMSTNEGTIDRTKIFNRSELEKATDNFNDNRILGRGGQGTVYKGMLVDGTIVAVKKSKKVDENQLAQFINEVAILSQINHRNVVKLFGCCLETDVPLLVYEFVSNATLYQHIHHPSEDFPLTWKVRFQIAVECAGAIAYLHSSCSSPIYHRDIKSSNILLDEKYKAKVSDFGTSRTISIDKTHVTTCVQGTFGYLDPEFFRSSQFNEKSDVYSFGVVLLELLTSKKPIFSNTIGEPRGLAIEFVEIMETRPNQLHEILDTQVLQHCSEEEVEELAKLIERCLSMNGKERPTMREVAMALEMMKSQQDKEGNHVAELEINGEERHVSIEEMNTTNENASINSTISISLPR